MDQHDVDRTADDRADDPGDRADHAGLRGPDHSREPRSYDPFDETALQPVPAWDSWSDPPSAFPQASPAPEARASWEDDAGEATVGMTVVFDDEDEPDDADATVVVPAVGAVLAGGTPPTVEADLLVAERFRLEEQLAERAGFLTWRAFDLKLSRPVLVHVLAQQDPNNDEVLAAAREAATATDSVFLRVLDAASSADELPYVVCEYVVGKSLEEVLQQGPLSGLEAAWVLREVARALAPMHAQGLHHLRLSPDTVIISSTGNVRIVGFLIDAALNPSPDDAVGPEQRQEADVHAMGQLLYAMLVSRWPVLPDEQHDPRERHHGLLPAPMDAEGWLTPRQVRAGVSPALDQLCDQVLHAQPRLGGPPITTAEGIDESLTAVLGTADASADLAQRVRHEVVPVERTDSVPAHSSLDHSTRSPGAGGTTGAEGQSSGGRPHPVTAVPAPVRGATPETPRRRPPKRRLWLRALLALVAVVLLGSLVAVGVRNSGTRSAGPASSGPTGSVVHPIAKVDDFDPEADGGNGEESPNLVARAWDKDPATAWTTLTYLNNPKLGGLKPGVGLVVDLGQVVEVGTVRLTLQGSPTAIQVLVPRAETTGATPPMSSVEQWRTVASSTPSGTSAVITLEARVSTRHLLVHLTSLPSVGGNKYRGAIAEIEVVS